MLAAALIALAWLPADYGAAGVFHFAESFATARLWAEAAGLAALALALAAERATPERGTDGRRRLARAGQLALTALCAAIHPIMALPVVGAGLALAAWRDWRWLALPAAAGAALIGAGLAGAPMAARLFQSLDPAWRAVTAERTPVVFPTLWPATSWAWIVCQLTTLALAARALEGPSRRLVIAAAGLGIAGLAVSLAWPNLLVVQLQPWRTLWLTAVMATGALPIVGWALWRQGGAGRAALAALTLAWVLRDSAAATAGCSLLALALSAWPGDRPFLRPVWIGALGIAAGVGAAVAALRLGAGLAVFGPITSTPAAALANAWRTGLQVPLGLAAALTLAIAGTRLSGRWMRAAGAAAAGLLAVLAVLLWDARAPFVRAAEDGRARLQLPAAASGAGVYWHDGFGAEWLITRRPDWWGRWQGAGMVFDRVQALEWERRRRLAAAAGLAPAVYRPSEGWPAPLTAVAARALCQAPGGPDVLIAPAQLVGDAALTGLATHWRAPTPELTPSADRRRLVAVADYAVISCAAVRVARR
ncbi:MAG TPA: hypothetical protein VHS81_04005 [Caulobacteraceae bacterium]|nr:hypothetical protein [Caulobacteraceae bacterium]